MHTTFSRRFPTIFALSAVTALGTATLGHAQSSSTQTLDIKAKVVQPLFVVVTQPLDFGTIFVGASKSIPSTDPLAGHVEIRGEPGAQLNITLTMPATLQRGTTGEAISTTNWTYSTNVQPSSTAFASGAPASFTLALLNTTTPARLTLTIGATATAGANQATGDYTGTGQVSIAYADI
jgi:lysozyme family protein